MFKFYDKHGKFITGGMLNEIPHRAMATAADVAYAIVTDVSMHAAARIIGRDTLPGKHFAFVGDQAKTLYLNC